MPSLIRSLIIIAIVAAGLYFVWPSPQDSKPTVEASSIAEPETSKVDEVKPSDVAPN